MIDEYEEDKMIRVNMQGATLIHDALIAFTGIVGNRFMGNPILWHELELAPPRGFEPKCKRMGELDGKCSPLGCLSWDECPFHKK